MSNVETAVMGFFNLGAAIGFTGAVAPEQLTANITAAFLMSICGNCTRILANPNAFPAEKILLSAAVLSYSVALCCDCNVYPILGTYLKLITTGCVGLWNAAQMIRLYAEIEIFLATRLQLSPPQSSFDSEIKMALAAFACYSLGGVIGFAATSLGLLIGTPPEKLGPYITLAFLMSHVGNLIRTEFNRSAQFFEKNFIRGTVLFYCIALYCDFAVEYEIPDQGIAAHAKLIAAGFVGLWNTVQTWRLNPTIYTDLIPSNVLPQSLRALDVDNMANPDVSESSSTQLLPPTATSSRVNYGSTSSNYSVTMFKMPGIEMTQNVGTPQSVDDEPEAKLMTPV